MAFKRAGWHSGFTYRQTCDKCNTVLEYTDYSLDFRPWYADGFVYCPKCKTPLRHNEIFAIDNPSNSNATIVAQENNVPPQNETVPQSKFCAACGHKFNETDRFCAQCGQKR